MFCDVFHVIFQCFYVTVVSAFVQLGGWFDEGVSYFFFGPFWDVFCVVPVPVEVVGVYLVVDAFVVARVRGGIYNPYFGFVRCADWDGFVRLGLVIIVLRSPDCEDCGCVLIVRG